MIAVDKPAGMVVHRGWARDTTTVYDHVRDEIIGAPVYAIHRLDRGTSGVLVFALDASVAQWLQGSIAEGTVDKRYLALVRGPMRDRWFVHHPIKQPPMGDRVSATTEFTPLAQAPAARWTLVEARPLTGRTHQIRLHLSHLRHPIVGDVKHGKGDINRHFREEYGFERLALHAASLVVPHPDRRGGSVRIEAPLPEDFCGVLEKLSMRHDATTCGDTT